jgi:predicted RNA-binding protein with PIN domain
MAKIKEEQLKVVTEQQQKLTTVLSQMGVLEIQKLNLAQEVKNLEGEVEKTKKELEEEYGKVSINLSDGTYEPIKDEQEDAK